jgi:3-dehydroquinate synthase
MTSDKAVTAAPAPPEICIPIELGSRSYPVIIGSDFSGGELGSRLHKTLAGRPVVIVSNETVWPLQGQGIQAAIEATAPASLHLHVLPDGEAFKTAEHWLNLLDTLAGQGITRDGVLVAVGGGVVCDMTGFAAACWMRGIDFVQIPTTLLAQVDASVGGKTGINHRAGKNLIGAFYQPRAVLINTQVLATLPEREFVSGLAEVIKYGFIQSADFVQWLQANAPAILARDSVVLNELVARCCRFKADIVRQDETEQGRRALLNLGHTFGHAIEALGEYKGFLHGEAVALGTVLAARLSERLELAPAGLDEQVTQALQALDLPTALGAENASSYTPQAMLERMRLDKKVQHGKHRLILLQDLGQAVIAEGVDEADILAVLAPFCSAS